MYVEAKLQGHRVGRVLCVSSYWRTLTGHPACSVAGQAAAARWFPIPACWISQVSLCRFWVPVFLCRIKYNPLADTETHVVRKERSFQLEVCSWGCRLGGSCGRGCFGANLLNSQPGLPKFTLSLSDHIYTLTSIPSLMPDVIPVRKQDKQ